MSTNKLLFSSYSYKNSLSPPLLSAVHVLPAWNHPLLFLFLARPTERERTERLIKAKLRSIMTSKDLENVTSKEVNIKILTLILPARLSLQRVVRRHHMPGCHWFWNVHSNRSVKALLWLCCTSLLRNQDNPSIRTVLQDLSNNCVSFKSNLKVLFPFFFLDKCQRTLQTVCCW